MNTIILDDTLKSLKAVLASAIATTQPTYTVHYGDATTTSFIEGSGDGVLNSTTPVTILAAPSASTRRIVREITVYNGDTVNVVLSLSLDNNGTDRMIRKVTIKPGETYSFSENSASNQFGEVSLVWDSTPATGVYGLLGGAVDGVNTVFTTSLAGYVSGSLMVYLNGQLLTTNSVDWSETSPTTGTFTFVIPPVVSDVVTVSYQRAYLASGNADTLDGSHATSFPLLSGINTFTGRIIFRTTASDPQHATPGSRPAGTVGEVAYYAGKWYGCTNAVTPTWEKFTSA